MSKEYVGVLGPVGLVRDGVLDSPQAPLPRALLGLLAVAEAPLSPESLIGMLWRHDPPRDPRSALHLAVFRLRNWLRANGAEVRIVTAATGYHLDAGRTDLALFREWTAGSEASFESLSRALGLWRGLPFANVPGKRFDSRLADTLLTERDAVTIRAARAATRQGRPAVAVALAEPLCHPESLDEAAHAVLIEALVAVGRQGAAALVYDGIRRRLATELGISPGTLLRQAHLACLSDPMDDDGLGGTGPATRRPGFDRPPDREDELARVAGLVAEHRVVTVIGPPGVGKTGFAARIAADGAGRRYTDVRRLELTETAARGRRVDGPAMDRPTSDRPASDRPASDRPTRDGLPETETALLVIDSGSCPPDLVRDVVERLIERRTPLAVLVVASRPLGISGEVIWAMRPLDLGAAELLFRRRAGEAVPGLVLTVREQPYVRELCRQADGLPVVVESLAALLRTFPLRELARQAAADLGSLIDDANPAAVRFTAGLDRVWRELTGPQRALLLRLTTLHRDFGMEDVTPDGTGGAGARDVDGAGTGCRDTDPPAGRHPMLNSLAALVDSGLVLPFETASGRRYRLLSPIRAMIAHHYAERVPLPTL
ncbi:AfsR/SARP family transcriptional regulator [Streptosporangium sp. CA-115845]|uniref:AfsR/SARP family transcriptional regulator n=1 Tax=Streptosporangium sp. CA-115845 TaxID=3240071 RepID=UPI003D94E1D7